ncbi:hypothetical protein [Francisella frigiditurris]|uniref:Chagasin peptidase inhibitor I42 family protein n=1 Tax=Francisella frigiditurris TaxID=1542390 RepID=A0A1J0KSP0_9GAMM|nr:hypothetical protein [Francisella frigiditurris]APC96781.1 chagasin peptidase inhibitor I42 family protein [Francisella frigiditurris]
MSKYLSLIIIFVISPFFVFAEMKQSDLEDVYSKPIVIEGNKATINIELPVDSISGYRWFLTEYNYDYIKAVSYQHESINVEKSKYGSLDSFKMSVHDRFKKIPQKIVLHFECFKPWELKEDVLYKDVVILFIPD